MNTPSPVIPNDITTTITMHASAVMVAGAGAAFDAPPDAGVLLLGPSGAGKSELALQLMERGAALVADDQTELFVRNDVLMARAPAPLAGLIELREIGIISQPFVPECRIRLVVLLEAGPRMPENIRFRLPGPLILPEKSAPLFLRINTGLAVAAKILLAVAACSRGLHRTGLNTL